MAVNFGELDYFGHAPANELKEKIQQIAFCHIQDMIAEFNFDEKSAMAFMNEVDGVIGMVEAIGETINEEVAHKTADVQQILQKFEKTGKLEEGGTDGNP